MTTPFEQMELISYSSEFQASLEEFLEIMYSYRGYKFEPTGLQSDIRNIENIYQSPGGNFWIMRENTAVIGSIGLKILNKIDKTGEIKRYFVLPRRLEIGDWRLQIVFGTSPAGKWAE